MAAIEDSRDLFDRGYYPQCVELLRSLLASGMSAEVLMELAQVYLFLGYANKALNVLRDFSQVNGPVKAATRRLEKMLGCFAGCLQSATFHDLVDEADRAYQEMPQTVSDMNLDTDDKRSEPIASELRLIFNHLQKAQNARLAFKVAMAIYPQEGKAQALSTLIDQPHVSHVIRAKAQIELANILDHSTGMSQRKELYDLAQASIGSLHAHAAIDIAVEQWAAGLTDLAVEATLDIDHARLTYEQLDYINGLKNLIHKQLDNAAVQHDHELEEDLERELTSLSVKGGFVLTWAMSHVNLIQRFSLWSGNDDMVWNAALTAHQRMVKYELPYQKGQCAYVLCEIAMRRGDIVAALEYSLKCQTEWSQCSNLSRSISDIMRAKAELQHLKASRSGEFENLRDRLTEWADRDLKDSLPGEAISKLELLLDPFFGKQYVDPIERRASVSRLIERMEGILEEYTGSDKDNRLANFFQSKALFLVSEGSKRTDCELELQAFQAFQQALRLYNNDAKDRPTFQTTAIKLQMGLLGHALFTKQQTIDKSIAEQILTSAITVFASCIEDSTILGQPAWITESEYWVALTKYEAAISGFMSVEDALEAIAAAERGFDERRNEISVTKGLGAVQAKQFLAKDKHVLDIYRFAFQLCLIMRKDETGAWEWVQKAKARSLSDTLGLGAIVPYRGQ